MRVVGIVLVAAVGLCACDSSGSLGPSSTFAITMYIVADGPFTVTFQHQTMTAPGNYSFNVPEGVQQVSGQIMGRLIQVGVRGAMTRADSGRSGGPLQGSLQNIQGPNAQLNVGADTCSIQYLDLPTPESRDFRFQFTVSASATRNHGNQCK